MPELELSPGVIAWASLESVNGREQGGHRPILIISSVDYLEAVTTLVMVTPVTSVYRGWPNHIRIDGPSNLEKSSWAMTEQIRTISRDRISSVAGSITQACLDEVRAWLADFLDLTRPGP